MARREAAEAALVGRVDDAVDAELAQVALGRPYKSTSNDYFSVGTHLILVCLFFSASMTRWRDMG